MTTPKVISAAELFADQIKGQEVTLYLTQTRERDAEADGWGEAQFPDKELDGVAREPWLSGEK